MFQMIRTVECSEKITEKTFACMSVLCVEQEPTFNRNVRVFQYESHTEVLCDAKQIANAETCGAMWWVTPVSRSVVSQSLFSNQINNDVKSFYSVLI